MSPVGADCLAGLWPLDVGGHVGVSIMLGRCADATALASLCVCVCHFLLGWNGGNRRRIAVGKESDSLREDLSSLESAEEIFFENVTEEEQTVKKLTPPP